MSVDNAIVNVPLSKRGDINAQLDRYKREQLANQRAEAKRRNAELVADRAIAKPLVASLSPERIGSFAASAGLTYAQAKKRLASDAHWSPRKIIAVFGGTP